MANPELLSRRETVTVSGICNPKMDCIPKALPEELILHVLSYADIKTISQVRQANKQLNRIAYDKSIISKFPHFKLNCAVYPINPNMMENVYQLIIDKDELATEALVEIMNNPHIKVNDFYKMLISRSDDIIKNAGLTPSHWCLLIMCINIILKNTCELIGSDIDSILDCSILNKRDNECVGDIVSEVLENCNPATLVRHLEADLGKGLVGNSEDDSEYDSEESFSTMISNSDIFRDIFESQNATRRIGIYSKMEAGLKKLYPQHVIKTMIEIDPNDDDDGDEDINDPYAYECRCYLSSSGEDKLTDLSVIIAYSIINMAEMLIILSIDKKLCDDIKKLHVLLDYNAQPSKLTLEVAKHGEYIKQYNRLYF